VNKLSPSRNHFCIAFLMEFRMVFSPFGKPMKTNVRIQAATIAIVALITSAQAQFTVGNLVVLQDGDGVQALSSSGNEIFLDQFTTGGALVNDLAIPTNGPGALLNSGTASSEGALNLSANGQYLVLAGYNVNYGYASSLPSSASTSVPRVVATVDASGNYTLAVSSSSFFSANNIRSGTTDGNGNFWAVGANSGVVYMGTGTPAAVSSTVANNRVIQDIGGNLYFSTGSGSRGIYSISGTPTSGSATANLLIPTGTQFGTGASPYDFAINGNTAYVADSNEFTNSTTVGGVEKWSYNGSAWVFDYSLSLGTNGASGLAVNFSGANPIIYATSADGKSLFDVVDTNSTATGTLLDTAAANTAFRGLDFSPTNVPEPATVALAGVGLTALWGFTRRNRKS